MLPIKTINSDKISSYLDLIKFVDDRPGHELRYSINSSKINKKLKWKPSNTIKFSLKKTINWYIENIHLYK